MRLQEVKSAKSTGSRLEVEGISVFFEAYALGFFEVAFRDVEPGEGTQLDKAGLGEAGLSFEDEKGRAFSGDKKFVFRVESEFGKFAGPAGGTNLPGSAVESIRRG